jgi:hypothetical protein
MWLIDLTALVILFFFLQFLEKRLAVTQGHENIFSILYLAVE